MKSASLSFFRIILGALGLSAATLPAEISEQDLGAFVRPLDEQRASYAAEEAKDGLAVIAKTATFPAWKEFEDERVKFSYPDDPAIALEVVHGEPVPIHGDRLSSVDTSYSYAYRLTAGGETYAMLMFRDADWLDDGVCFCGEVVYQRYLLRRGNLHQYSFLEDGIMKQMQVLGNNERVLMFEWTHLPIHPAVYRKIARSIELKKQGSWQGADCIKRVKEIDGPWGCAGWFDEDSPEMSVTEVLGAPSKVTTEGLHIWEYPKSEGDFRWKETLSLPFSNGKLVRFGPGFYDSAWNKREAVKGSTAWMLEQAEPYEELPDPDDPDDKAKKMPEEMKKELLALFLVNAKVDDANIHALCQVMQILVKHGVNDQQALDIVRKRFASEGGNAAAWVLHEAGHPEDLALFADAIRKICEDGKKQPDYNFVFNDLHNLLGFIGRKDPRYPELLRGGLSNPNESIRKDAYYFLGSAPFEKEERSAFVLKGLRDSSEDIRYWAGQYSSTEDLAILRAERKAEEGGQDVELLKEKKTVPENVDAPSGDE